VAAFLAACTFYNKGGGFTLHHRLRTPSHHLLKHSPFPPGARFGGGGGRMQHDDEDDEDVDTTAFYQILGVPKTASVSDIRRAYLTISKSKDHPRRHPDKGGDPKAFAELQNAYEVLSDEDKRAAYDRGGEAATKEGGGGGGGPADLFEMLCVVGCASGGCDARTQARVRARIRARVRARMRARVRARGGSAPPL